MKIIVCIKQVPDTTEIRLDPKTGTLIRDGVPSIINPDDKSGIEEALKLKEKFNAHITVISMGPTQAEAILREGLAMGCDKAILLTDRKFAGADTLATSRALAAALRNIPHDLIITGRQAIDGDTAQVGPQIAEHLGLPQITYLRKLDFDGNNTVKIEKAFEDGYQIVEVQLPCVVTVLADANTPRYMSVSGIVDAFKKDVDIWDVTKITIDENHLGLNGSPTWVNKSFTRGKKEKGKLLDNLDPKEAAKVIIENLKAKYLI